MAERFTLLGGPEVEALIGQVCEEVVERTRKVVPSDKLRVLALVGGYGRGEGGIKVRDGMERPANNLDFLLVPRGIGLEDGLLKARLGQEIAKIEEKYGIGIDIGVVSDMRLMVAPCKVMWYDVRFGHKSLLGDKAFLPSLSRFRADTIDPLDVRDLMINRGTLLVIVRVIMERGLTTEDCQEIVLRYLSKAIIGYGDAWLFFHKDYHWSYVERNQRMKRRADAPPLLRALYCKAMDYRFKADQELWGSSNLEATCQEVEQALANVHLEVESLRLCAPDLSYDEYPRVALNSSLRHTLSRPRLLARRLREGKDLAKLPKSLGLWERLAWFALPLKERVATIFPGVAFSQKAKVCRQIGLEFLTPGIEDDRLLRRSYLEAWGKAFDPNFFLAARRLGLFQGGGVNDMSYR